MRACAAESGLYLFVSGCASSQLNYNTLDLATSVGGIQTQQVLYNLGLILDGPSIAARSASRTVEFLSARDPIDHERLIERIS
jgi:hypothetical protein